MSRKYVTAYYLDARDGRPANEAPPRHGPIKPSENLEVSAVDRRESPPVIIGSIPSSESLAAGMALIEKADHDNMLASVDAWKIDNELRDLEKWREAQEPSAFRAFAALDVAGYLDQVETMMADPETPRVHRLAFEKAQTFRRLSPTVAAWQEKLAMTDAEMDELFVIAAELPDA